MKKDYIFISESVTEGHPDKLCDQISDAIVDQILMKDSCAKIRAEVAVFTNILFIAVRFESEVTVDFPNIARGVIKQIGYDNGFNPQNCSILTSIKQLKSRELVCFDERTLTDEDIDRIHVFDPATVFGYACNQTPAYMPLPIWLAHKLARRLSSVRYQNILEYLEPDGKTQVSIEYKDGKPFRVDTISIIASQSKTERDGGPSQKKLYNDLYETVILPSFVDENIKIDEKTRIIINPEGPVVPGGPLIHSGLTGRKNAIDTYGEYSRNN
jgi:S-adenosylmethionine synthetase